MSSVELGGGERNLRNLVCHTDRSRFSPAVVCLYRKGELAADLRQAGAELTVLHLDSERRARHLAGAAIRGLAAEFRRRKPVIVHAHMAAACWYGLPAARLAGVPVRIGHLQNRHVDWRPHIRAADRAAALFATDFIACSEAVRDFFVDRQHYPRARIRVIPNGVDLGSVEALPARATARRELDLGADVPVLLCVASLNPQKGHAPLLAALADVRRTLPDVQLLLAGRGTEEPVLRRIVDDLAIGPSVRFLGVRDDVGRLLAAADLFVLPSLWEGMPLALIEAGAAGTTAIATRLDEIAEVVDDGATGVLVKPGDSAELAAAIVSLLGDPERRRHIGERARAHCRARFDARLLAGRVDALYGELLDRRASGRAEPSRARATRLFR